MTATTIGIDLAKNVFHLCGMNRSGRVLWRKKLKRSQVLPFLHQQSACTVAMESCGGSHYWARQAQAIGHEARLLSGQFVKPFVKSNKNDVIDAEAICEAANRPTMRFVPIKSSWQQDIQALHRKRELLLKHRTALVNQCRGLLMEYGLTIPKGRRNVLKILPTLLEENPTDVLSPLALDFFCELYEDLQSVGEKIARLEHRLELICKENDLCTRLTTIPGIGTLTATALVASVGNGFEFKNGRHMSAWLGIVPKQVTTGGKPRLLGISKRGDKYLRKLLIHGARSVLIARSDLGGPQQWANSLKGRTCNNKAAVALANKNARIVWALLRSGETYRPDYRAAA